MQFRLEINPTDGIVNDHPLYLDLIRILNQFYKVVIAKDFKFERIPASNNYFYLFESITGRKWKQTLFFTSDSDENPNMIFQHNDQWRKNEVAAHAPLRDVCIKLKTFSPTLNLIKAGWS